MAGDLLQTKLYVPKRPNGRQQHALVPRPHLIQKLNDGLTGKLTLVSAPAGFGKTTLVTEWLSQLTIDDCAWLSLDEHDNNLVRFWAYLIAALQKFEAGMGGTAVAMLQAPQRPPVESILTNLLNDITQTLENDQQRAIILVLDDYHVLDSQQIGESLAFFLDHQPLRFHLVITSRADPPLPLSRLRVRQEMMEIRADDLRLTAAETAVFLNEIMGLSLTAGQVKALETRTEGWIAGLQLAALSMNGRADIADFIDAFSGSNRFVIDYLADEVLQQQDEDIRQFLSQTAILDRLTADLCDAVTQRKGSQALLTRLEQANLFLVPLDDQRKWYRYHHLFADFLRAQPETLSQAAALHDRAAHWYEAHDFLSEAAKHALATGDLAQAARVVALAADHARKQGEVATAMGWLDALPDEIVRANFGLSALKGLMLLLTGQVAEAAVYVNVAESALPADELTYRFDLLQLRANLELARGNMVAAARLTQEMFADEDIDLARRRCSTLFILGDAHWQAGDIAAASHSYEAAIRAGQESCTENEFIAIAAPVKLALLRNAQGQRRQAMGLAMQLVDQYITGVSNPFPLAGYALIVRGHLQYEANALEQACTDLEAGLALCQPQTAVDAISALGYMTLANLHQARGEPAAALETIHTLTQTVSQWHLPNFLALAAAAKADLHLCEGDMTKAVHWAETAVLSPIDAANHLREPEQLTYARLLLVQRRLDDAQTLLATLEQAAQTSGRQRSLITIHILQALTHQANNQRAKALICLEKALRPAAPEGYRRAFLDEGTAVAGLLVQAHQAAPDFVDGLLAELETAVPAATALIEPLNENELHLLRLIATGLTNQEAADELYLSLNTIKWHLKNVYGKLNVHSRVEAITRARELGLLS